MENPLLYTIPYNEFDKWYVESYLNTIKISSSYPLISLGKIIKPKGVCVNKDDYDNSLPIIDKIRFSDGQVFFRKKNDTKMNVYYSDIGDLVVSKINFHQGALAINTFGKVACTTHYQVYNINRLMVDDQFLVLVLRSKLFMDVVASNKAKGIKNESGFEFIKNIKIPVPPLDVQNKLVSDYNSSVIEAETLQLLHSYSEIENEIEKTLSLMPYNGSNQVNTISLVPYSEMSSWDIKNKHYGILKSSKFKQKTLSAIAQINPALSIKLLPEEEIAFIPMECVSDLDGCVQERRTCQASAKGFTKFENGDVIWAKITPCMQNGKSAVMNNLQNGVGYGSTEFYVIRVDKSKVIPEYIHYLLRMYRIREHAVNYFSGSAGQQRVRKSFLEELSIPLPSLPEQIELVERLNKIKIKIIDNRNQANALMLKAKQDFENAIFD